MTQKEIRDRVQVAQKNYDQTLKSIETILRKERGFASRIPRNEDVVAICSGGMDSVIMIDKIIEDWQVTVHPLFFRRGQRALKFEEESFDYFISYYKNKFKDKIGIVSKLNCEIPPEEYKESFLPVLAKTVGHPLRNSTMENLAVMYAVALNGKYDLDIRTVFVGAIGEDKKEPELGLLSLRSQTLNACINTGDWRWQITSPFTDLRKQQIYKIDLIKYAIKRQLPLEKMRTCFSSSVYADRTCNACKKRLNAFQYLKLEDPYKYEASR